MQIPDALLAAAHAKRGAVSLNVYLCTLLAADTGAPFVPVPRGRPKDAAPKKPRAKPKGKKP